MKKPEREYPDIEFLETDTETIESNMIALYEELVNKELVFRQPCRAFQGY